MATKNEVTKTQNELSYSERFTNAVMNEFKISVGDLINVTDYQRQLVQGYFIGIDRMLKTSEQNRIIKNERNTDHKYDNNLPYTWANINMEELAIDVMHYSKLGLDMLQKNHISPIAYKNNKANNYSITLMKGYEGIEFISRKYAFDEPLNVVTELVYENDMFKPLKKSEERNYESYFFDIPNPFDRGKIVGGFGYIEYKDKTKNKLIFMSMKDIKKRIPSYASAEFWGGEKTVYEDGKKVKKHIDGWFDEMCLKTIKRAVYDSKNIAQDPSKIDEHYEYMKMKDSRMAEIIVDEQVQNEGNQEYLDDGFAIDKVTGEISIPEEQQNGN